MDVCLVWAQGSGRVIGRENALPWRLPEDLAFFKRLTMGSPIIMGRKTWESLGRRALPGRLNIVISSSQEAIGSSTAFWAPSIEAALDLAHREAPDTASGIYVIGGATIYGQAMQHASRIYITEVEVDVDGADTFAPELPDGMFGAVASSGTMVSAGGLRYRFDEYRRAPAAQLQQNTPR